MAKAILMAYASRYGTTQEVAETIGTILREHALQVQVQPIHEVRSLDGIDAVVFGAALQVGAWPKEAHRFLNDFQAELTTRPLVVFSMGPFHANDKEMSDSREQVARELDRHPGLKPLTTQVFVGKFDPKDLKPPMDSIPALKNMPATDEMDRDAIRAWANQLPVLLGFDR